MFSGTKLNPQQLCTIDTAFYIVSEICGRLDADPHLSSFAKSTGLREVALHLGWTPKELLEAFPVKPQGSATLG